MYSPFASTGQSTESLVEVQGEDKPAASVLGELVGDALRLQPRSTVLREIKVLNNRLAALRFFYIKTLKKGWSIAETPYSKRGWNVAAPVQELAAYLVLHPINSS
jgi:hypothetical protein